MIHRQYITFQSAILANTGMTMVNFPRIAKASFDIVYKPQWAFAFCLSVTPFNTFG